VPKRGKAYLTRRKTPCVTGLAKDADAANNACPDAPNVTTETLKAYRDAVQSNLDRGVTDKSSIMQSRLNAINNALAKH
jgi:hypothetical protein